jgi:hypothetical protein
MYMSKHVLVRFNKTWDGYIVSYSVANSEEKEEAIYVSFRRVICKN